MRKQLKAVLFVLLALILPSLSLAQVGQPLTQTTLTATIGSGTQCFQLASVSGISGFGPGILNPVGGTAAGTGNITDLYIDRELMQVISVNAAGKNVCVLHGQGGSQASAHAVGTMVLAGPPGAFFNYNPEGFCGGTNVAQIGSSQSNPPQFNPWVNQTQGTTWICSTITNTWTPGFVNLFGETNVPTTAVTSAATIVPTGPLFHITGTVSMVNITTPVGCNATAVGGCQFTAICDAVCVWTAAGNISVASGTVVAGSSITFTWDAKNSKWVPSTTT